MSMMALGASAPLPVPRKVLGRTLVWSGGIIEIEIPLELRAGSITTDEGEITYLQFPRFVRDKRTSDAMGVVNFFVHTTGGAFANCAGEKIVAKMQIWRKNLGNQSFLYVDLHSVPEGTVPTHQFVGVMEQRGMERDSIPFATEDCLFFETPAPLFGVIVVAPLDARKREKPGQASTTGYAALDRKIHEDGWFISSQDDKVVNLYKIDASGNRRTDTFYKPQPKTKKKR
jgi:hypothetical protein